MIDDELTRVEEITTLVNSYTSCMIGKIEEKLEL